MVQHVVNIDYPLTFENSNVWGQVPDMHICVDLKYSQFVNIKYKILVATSHPNWNNNHLVTRVKVDGVEDPIFRHKTGNTVYHTNTASDRAWLCKGKHEITVEYRTPANIQFVPKTDSWMLHFAVEYMALNSPQS